MDRRELKLSVCEAGAAVGGIGRALSAERVAEVKAEVEFVCGSSSYLMGSGEPRGFKRSDL